LSGISDTTLEALRVPIQPGDPYTRAHDALVRYIATYREHARIIGLIEQAATITEELRELRLALTCHTASSQSEPSAAVAVHDALAHPHRQRGVGGDQLGECRRGTAVPRYRPARPR
jgi:hypothetical protein